VESLGEDRKGEFDSPCAGTKENAASKQHLPFASPLAFTFSTATSSSSATSACCLFNCCHATH
jgi:hypothetical protein